LFRFNFTDTVYQETLVIHYEKEEEFMTNQLSKKMNYLKNEKVELEVDSSFLLSHLLNLIPANIGTRTRIPSE